MKNFTLFLLTLFLVSCNNDDDKNEVRKRITDVEVVESDGYVQRSLHFNYNADGNISEIIEEGEVEFTLSYDGNRLISIASAYDTQPIQFIYTNNILSSINDYGTELPVSYNSATKTYTISEFALIKVNGRGMEQAQNTEGLLVFNADLSNSQKGALYGLPTESFFMIQLFTSSYYFLSEKPMTSMYVEGISLTVNNVFDADGYLEKMTLDLENDDSDLIVNYRYE